MHNRRTSLALLLVVALLSTVLTVAATGGVAKAKGHDHDQHNPEHRSHADCLLAVPSHPLSAKGLATPWLLSSGRSTCHESDPNTAVFVQATIFSPSTKQFFVYSPLVIDRGTKPAIAPVLPTLPADAVVGIWGGGNGGSTRLIGHNAWCDNGSPGVFGQVFFCGARNFFAAVNAAGVTPPPLGTAIDGLPCPTTRDFMVVDQDQSDNVQTNYLISASGQMAQASAANEAALPGFSVQTNGSDNVLLTELMDKALGCTPWTAPDLANNGAPVLSQALDEIQANAEQAAPQALIPAGDPMVLTPSGGSSLHKINEYRIGVDQPVAASLADASTATYCMNILANAPARLSADSTAFAQYPSLSAAVANNLWTFIAARLSTTLSSPVGAGGLGCVGTGGTPGGLLNLPNPVHLMLDANGVVIAATIDH